MSIKRKKIGVLERQDRKLRIVSRIIVYICAAVSVYPILFVMLTSLKTDADFYSNVWGLPKEFAWENFATAWNVGNLADGFAVSVVVTVTSMLLIILFGTLGGYALARLKVPLAGFIMILILITFMLPSEAVITPLYLMLSKFGITDYAVLIIPYIGWSIPMTITIMRNFFLNMPNELLEAARVDGCTEMQTFFKISLPLLTPALAVSSIFAFVGVWGELIWAQIALSTSSTLKTITMSMMQFQGQYNIAWGPMSAAICIIMVPLVVFFIFVQKYFVQGLTGGAVKG